MEVPMTRILLAGAVAILLASATSLRAADVFVDTLDLTKAHPATTAKPAGTVNGKKAEHLVALKPNASLVIDTKGNAKSFSTSVGLDGSSNTDAKARFYIVGDGKLLAESGIMEKNNSAKTLTADLSGVKQLVLRVDDVFVKDPTTLALFVDPKITLTNEGGEKPVTVAANEAMPELVVHVDELDVSRATTGWNEPQINRSAEYNPVTIREKTFLHAFGTHAPSTFVINIKGAAKSFSAIVGVDDDADNSGTIGFTVIGDGKVLAKTGTIGRDTPAKELKADLTGVQQLVLLVDSGDDDDITMDHADWGDAKITLDPAKAKDRPEARPSTEAKLPR
jgi:hypothetical protein